MQPIQKAKTNELKTLTPNNGQSMTQTGSGLPKAKSNSEEMKTSPLGDRSATASRKTVIFTTEDFSNVEKLNEALENNYAIFVQGSKTTSKTETVKSEGRDQVRFMPTDSDTVALNLGAVTREITKTDTQSISPKNFISFLENEDNAKFFPLITMVSLAGYSETRGRLAPHNITPKEFSLLEKLSNLTHLGFKETTASISIEKMPKLKHLDVGRITPSAVQISNTTENGTKKFDAKLSPQLKLTYTTAQKHTKCPVLEGYKAEIAALQPKAATVEATAVLPEKAAETQVAPAETASATPVTVTTKTSTLNYGMWFTASVAVLFFSLVLYYFKNSNNQS